MPSKVKACGAAAYPARAGIGLRAPHYRDVLERNPNLAFLEVHSENYFGGGGLPRRYLEQFRARYPLSLHGVGLSLGSTDPLNERHLDRLKQLVERFEPALVSEHLSWSSVGGRYFNDLIPLPYTEEALAHVVERIGRVQERLGRTILMENPSTYLSYRHSTIPEWDFLAETARRSGCGILLDVNNIYVSAVNHGFDPFVYLKAIPRDTVKEFHLAGFTVNRLDEGEILIDTHNRPVADPVWDLFREAVLRVGPVPTLVEWDSDLPPLDVLLDEAAKADAILEERHALVA